MLTKTNYSDWALLMKVKLRARLLWTAIEKGGVKPHEDMQALDALCIAVPPEMWPVIADKETAKEAWEAITTMRFRDDSVARIEGKGAIVFSCKNGEHQSFAGVYYIPCLTTNIVSIGQLDEAEYHINLKDGAMKVHEPGGQLLAKVMRGKNTLYLLHAKLVRPMCLVMWGAEEAWKWHARLGHVNLVALRKMAKEELVRGLP